MPTAGPSGYIDKKTGELRRLQTLRDYLLTEALPAAAHMGLLGLKSAIVYTVFGPGGLIVPAAGYLLTRQNVLAGATRSHEAKYNSPFKSDALSVRFDLTQEKDRQEYMRRYGGLQPNLLTDVLHIAKTIGLNELPTVEIIDPARFDVAKNELELRNLHAGIAMTCRPDGKRPVLMFGAGAMENIAPDEMRGIVAHEMTHAKLNHPRQKYLHTARMAGNTILNVFLFGATLLGALPLLPTLGFIVVTGLAQQAVESIRSRRREHLCDQGAALITGHTKEFTSGLNKVSKSLSYLRTFMINRERLKKGLPSMEPAETGKLLKFIFATHPDDAPRLKRVADFGKKYPDFCTLQKSKFAATFNAVATYEKKKPPQPARAPQRLL